MSNPIVKNLSATIDLISNFQQNVTISGLPFPEREARLYIENRGLRLDFDLTIQEAIDCNKQDLLHEFHIIDNSRCKYVVPERDGILSGTLNIGSAEGTLQNYNIKFAQLMDERWCNDNEYYYRFLLPIEKIFWDRDINTYWFNVGNRSSSGLLILNFPEGTVHVYHTSIGEKKYLVIESTMECSRSLMERYIYSIALSFGLITSIVPFDYTYIIATKDENFVNELMFGFAQMRPTIKGQYLYFTTNMYSLKECLQRNKAYYAINQLNINGAINNSLQPWMDLDKFDNIVQMLYKNENLARATLILIEASNNPLDYQGAMCAVALETICSTLEDPKDNVFMTKTEWKTKVKPPFDKFVNELKNNGIISEAHAINMHNKFSSLNNDSNQNKLSIPFSKRGYKLSEQEKQIINNRNKFLHGNIISKGCLNDDFEANWYACLELQKLCSILLFRESGFKGYIVNNAVLLGRKQAIQNKEPILI